MSKFLDAVTDGISNLVTAPADPVAGDDVTNQLRIVAASAYILGNSLGHANEAKGKRVGWGMVTIY